MTPSQDRLRSPSGTAAAGSAADPSGSAPAGRPPAWLADAVLYQIYPQSYADSGGDGVGDLPGLLARLDYLQWLGVDVIWLSPLFASPFRDAGYNVSDYFSVAPRYGTNEDLVALVKAAGGSGTRVRTRASPPPRPTSCTCRWIRPTTGPPSPRSKPTPTRCCTRCVR